jgi:Zn finger protein HypA/HybF involved in hydrogenase expression
MTSRNEPLNVTNPELAAQADGWDPTTVTAGSHKKVGWKCESGHTWISAVNNRSRGRGCPVCSGHQLLVGFNDLATTHPELAAQADGWDPATVIAGGQKKMRWKCELGHVWTSTVNNRSSGRGCPVCSGHQVLVGYNDLATTHPELAAQAHGWDPTTLKAGSNKEVEWKCVIGHRWKASVNTRKQNHGCPICSGHQLLVGFNDLATTHPELAAQADGWDPTTIRAGTHKKLNWICEKGHRWNAQVKSRKTRGCPVCSGHQVVVSDNDLATTHPELAAQAHGWDPTTLKAGSNKKVGWKCELGHVWTSTVNHRSSGRGCPVCSGHQLLVGFNDLATTNPELAAQAHGWDPTKLAAFSNKKVGWKCELGHVWTSTVNNRSRGQGCPSCSQSGFDPNLPGWLYFIDNDELQMFQIGISNFPESRLGQHSKRGWEVIEVRGPMEGHLAQELETAILHAIERRGAILGHKAQIDKFDGYSEAWTKKSLSVSSLKQLFDWIYEDDH